MFFEDYRDTKRVYHIAPINDLNKILKEGIRYDDKISYKGKYYEFHQFIDQYKNQSIPPWVKRTEAIYATMNYREHPGFHAHTVVLAIKVDPAKCWIANENRANQIYEPFILQEIDRLQGARSYVSTRGVALAKEYWDTSISFEENLYQRLDLQKGYDAEVLVLHSIPPEDIQVLFIISDHRILTLKQWIDICCCE